MRVERVLLVSAPLDSYVDRKEAVNSHCFPPLGLLAIATCISREFADIEVRVLDGDLVGLTFVENFVESFRPDIVGVSVLTPSYRSAVAIARHSKAAGVRYVVFGNDHASFLPEAILRRHADISFIIVGDQGEKDFVDLVGALHNHVDPFEVVSNLYGFAGGDLRSSPAPNHRQSSKLPTLVEWPDPSFLADGALARYQEAYARRFGVYHKGRSVKPFIVNNARGCYKADNRCFYCSIYDLQSQTGDVRIFWEAIKRYWENYGLNFFFEVCDNFGALKAYRRSMVQSIPQWFIESDVELMVYADSNVIAHDRGILDDLRRLHVKRVNIGFDSADPAVLRLLKGFREPEVNRRAVEFLGSHDIQTHCSFVLGGPGEDEHSLSRTVAFIEEILQEPQVVAVEVSPLFPLPRAPVWDLFLGELTHNGSTSVLEALRSLLRWETADYERIWRETRAYFLGNDFVDLTLASQLWANYFTAIGYERLMATVAHLNGRISDAGKVAGGFG